MVESNAEIVQWKKHEIEEKIGSEQCKFKRIISYNDA